MKKLYELFV